MNKTEIIFAICLLLLAVNWYFQSKINQRFRESIISMTEIIQAQQNYIDRKISEKNTPRYYSEEHKKDGLYHTLQDKSFILYPSTTDSNGCYEKDGKITCLSEMPTEDKNPTSTFPSNDAPTSSKLEWNWKRVEETLPDGCYLATTTFKGENPIKCPTTTIHWN